MRFIMPRFFVNCERWKWNEDLRLYVSTHGHFKDEHKRNKACKVKDNYFWINVDDKWLPAHRVVLLTWRPLPVDGDPMTVDHLNSITRDNRLCNLEWVSREENLQRAEKNHLIHTVNPIQNPFKTKWTVENLSLNTPLLFSELGFSIECTKAWTDIINEVRAGRIVFRFNNRLYSAQEFFCKFNKNKNANADKFIRKIARTAMEERLYEDKKIELIKVI